MPASPTATAPALAPDARRPLHLALGLFVLAGLGLLVATSGRARLNMDEFYLLSQWMDQREGLYTVVDPLKTVVATELFAIPRRWADDSVSLLVDARAIGLGVALAIAAVTGLAAWRLSRSVTRTLLTLATLVACTPFSEQAFRIRCDTVQALLAVVGLAWMASGELSNRRAVGAGALAGAAFCTTQKAIFVLAAFALATLLAERGADRRRFARLARLVAAFAAVLLAYGLFWGGRHAGEVLAQVFRSAWRLGIEESRLYPGMSRYLAQTARLNVVPWAAAAVGFAGVFGQWRTESPARRWVATASAALLAATVLQPQPWPYVFVLSVPGAALWAGEAPAVLARLAGGREPRYAWGLLVLLGLQAPRAARYLERHTLDEQVRVVAEAESFLAPEDRYFDATGMLPARRSALVFPEWVWYRAAVDAWRTRLLADRSSLTRALAPDAPKILLLTYHLRQLPRAIAAFTRGAYVRVSPTVLLAGIEIPPGAPAVEFECRWPGGYRLFDAHGVPLGEPVAVDGAAARGGAARLAIGRHRLDLAPSAGERLWLPAGARVGGRVPDDAPVPDLFAEVYE